MIYNDASGQVNYMDPDNITMDFNTIVGLQGFRIGKQASNFRWTTQLQPGQQISVTIAPIATSLNQYWTFGFMVLEQNWCGPPTPYLHIATNTCYDICPTGTTTNETNLSCDPELSCPYDCNTCLNSTACATCDEAAHYRTMDNATHRCLPISGYYDGG
jgi:hypothetical protein